MKNNRNHYKGHEKPKNSHGPSRPPCFVCLNGVAPDRGWVACGWCSVLHHQDCWQKWNSCRVCGTTAQRRPGHNSEALYEEGVAAYKDLTQPEGASGKVAASVEVAANQLAVA